MSSVSYVALRGVSLGNHGDDGRPSWSERGGVAELWDNLKQHVLTAHSHAAAAAAGRRFAPREIRKVIQEDTWEVRPSCVNFSDKT